MSKNKEERKIVKSTLEDFNLVLLLYIVKQNILWCFSFILLGLIIAYATQKYTPLVFQAETELMQKTTKQTQILGVEDLLADEQSEVVLEIKLLKSKLLIERAIDSLPLDLEYFAKGLFMSTEYYKNAPFKADLNILDNKIYETNIYIYFTETSSVEIVYEIDGVDYSFNENIANTIKTPHFDLNITKEQETTHNNYYITPRSKTSIVSEISKIVEVYPTNGNSKTIKLKYKHTNPSKAKDIINAIANTFIEYDREKKSESINSIISFLDNQIDNFGKEFYAFQDTIKKFHYESGFVNPEDQVSVVLKKIELLEEESREIKFQKNILIWFKNYIEEDNSLSIITSLIFSENIFSFEKDIDAITLLEQEREKKLLVVTPEHPEITIIDNQINILKSSLLNQITLSLNKLEESTTTSSENIAELYNQLYSLPDKENTLSKLTRENEVKEKFFFNLIENKNRYLISRAGIVSDYIILQKVTTPKKPITPDKNTIWLTGVFVGVLLSIILIAIRYLLYQKVTTIKELNENTNGNVLGIIPKNNEKLDKSKIVVIDKPKSSMSEAFRSIRSNLEFIPTKNKSKVIVTTSTIPGEGKTFVGINLAAIFSLMNKKVILLDFDLRKPRLAKIFGVDNNKGLSTYIIGKNSFEDCIKQTGYQNIDVIPSGPLPPNPAELIMTEEVKSLIKSLKEQYDYIFIDTPPVGLVTDAIELLSMADYPLYIIRSEYSERQYLEHVNKLIFDNDISNLSLLLNDFSKGGASGGYGYRYGYGYGYGSGYYSDDVEIEKKWLFKLKNLFKK